MLTVRTHAHECVSQYYQCKEFEQFGILFSSSTYLVIHITYDFVNVSVTNIVIFHSEITGSMIWDS